MRYLDLKIKYFFNLDFFYYFISYVTSSNIISSSTNKIVLYSETPVEAQNDKNQSMMLSFTFRVMDAVAQNCRESQKLFQE